MWVCSMNSQCLCGLNLKQRLYFKIGPELCKYTKTTKSYTLKGWTSWYVNYISNTHVHICTHIHTYTSLMGRKSGSKIQCLLLSKNKCECSLNKHTFNPTLSFIDMILRKKRSITIKRHKIYKEKKGINGQKPAT